MWTRWVVYWTVTTVCTKTFTIYIRVTVSAPNVLAADVFGTASIHRHLVIWISCCWPHNQHLPFPKYFPTSSPRKLVSMNTRNHVVSKIVDKPDSQIKYKRNIEARSCNHCWRWKAISITYSECVFVAFGIQHAMRMRHIAICGPFGCTKIFRSISQKGTILEEKFIHSFHRFIVHFDSLSFIHTNLCTFTYNYVLVF
jgi:hypothetical protein